MTGIVDGERAPVSEYAYHNQQGSPHHLVLRPSVDRFLEGTPDGADILDLGCGNGSFIAQYRGRRWNLSGIDLSESGIEIARRSFEGITFYSGDVTGNPEGLAEESFDVVICLEVVEHVYHPRHLARNCFRLLRAGGHLIISTPYHGYLKNLGISLTNTHDRHFDPLWDHGHIKFWSRETLPLLLREQGFDNLEFLGAGRLPFLWRSMVYKARRPPA